MNVNNYNPSSENDTDTTAIAIHTDDNTHNHNQNISESIISDILLSIAKDNRYIQTLTFLLSQAVYPFLPLFTTTTTTSTATTTFSLHIIQPELTLLARIIFAYIIYKDDTTISQEYLHLKNHYDQNSYSNNNNGTQTRQGRKKQKANNKVVFIILYTLLPYMIQRAGRQGWNEFKQLVIQSYIKCHRFLTMSTNHNRNSNYQNESRLEQNNERQQQQQQEEEEEETINTRTRRRREAHQVTNHDNLLLHSSRERLHGKDRKQIYYEMRRQMIDKAIEIETTLTTAAAAATTTTTTAEAAAVTGPLDVVNEEEGEQTQQVEERLQPKQESETQEQLLLTTENSNQYSSSPQSHPTSYPNNVPCYHHNNIKLYINTLSQQLKHLSWTLLLHIHEATTKLALQTPTAHETVITNNNNNNLNEISSSNMNQQLNANLVGFIKWIIRLNLALFYANGIYPTLLHRFTGTKIGMKDYTNEQNKPRMMIMADRPSYKPIAYLILLQSGAQLIQGIINLILDIQERKQRQQQRLDIGTGNEMPTFTSLLERCVPSLSSSTTLYNVHNNAPLQNNFYARDNNNNSEQEIQCGICMNNRKHPSTLRNCGHVFCWNCIQHWIATVRPECPLCRTPSRPQEVIVLYNYSPS